MPPILIGVLVLLIIFAWFIVGEEKSFGEKLGVLLIFVGLYAAYRFLNGSNAKEVFIDPLMIFFKR
jgi:hypothetical protein